MAIVKPFRGLRPPNEYVEQVECRPYDVLNSEEAKEEAGSNEMSLYHIIKPEIDFEKGINEYDERVYDKAVDNFKKFQNNGWLLQDEKELYYIYAQTMNHKTQYGFVVAASIQDYLSEVIKKHELTRKDKEEDRMKHVRINDANIEPVFLAYPDNEKLAGLIEIYKDKKPEYKFTAPVDGFVHEFWLVCNEEDINIITEEFAGMPSLYIADGHHRSAAAVSVGIEKSKQNPNHTGKEEYNYFMAVCFPESQLTVLDYNRVVTDLNGLSSEGFLKALEKDFEIYSMGEELYKPAVIHEFSLYMDQTWYRLKLRQGRIQDEQDPVEVLDVTISSRLILEQILDIKDLRADKRIDFVGGLRGLKELKRRCDSGEMKIALALYPVSMKQIMDIADNGKIMPPKATWFEPKLRSGLVIHKLS